MGEYNSIQLEPDINTLKQMKYGTQAMWMASILKAVG